MARKNRNRTPSPRVPDITADSVSTVFGAIGGINTAAPKRLAVSPAELNTADALINAALGPQPPALGNMSEADLAAIRGAAPEMTATEALLNGPMATEGQPFTPEPVASPEQLGLAARVLTLEARHADLEKAVEALAAHIRTTGNTPAAAPRIATVSSGPVARPTPEEEAQYCETNLALQQQNERSHDGIQAWRDAGSPVLKAKPVVSPLQRGRAA